MVNEEAAAPGFEEALGVEEPVEGAAGGAV